jgi:hypothetical protein
MSTEKPSRNEGEYFAQQNAELIRKQRGLAESAAQEAERKTHYMKCPKDGHDLGTSDFHGVQIETCPHCGGIWLDAGELQLLAHEHRRALLTQLIADGFEALQSGKKPGATA